MNAWSFLKVTPTLLYKETIGSPEFPGYPCKHMTWSKTPVVTRTLSVACPGLLPSSAYKLSAFASYNYGSLSNDHNYTFFGAQYIPCILDPPGFGLPLPGLPSGFTTALLVRR